VELHNTLFAARGEPVDGLADAGGLRAWLAALERQLPVEPGAVDAARLDDFLRLRAAVRAALQSAVDGEPVPAEALAALNAASATAPRWIGLVERGRERVAQVNFVGGDATDIVLGEIAAQTVELLAGPRAADLRACGAPGCVLMFLKDHPRREWCSPACGNRARQARHYARTHGR